MTGNIEYDLGGNIHVDDPEMLLKIPNDDLLKVFDMKPKFWVLGVYGNYCLFVF